jgi:hypothetical protein
MKRELRFVLTLLATFALSAPAVTADTTIDTTGSWDGFAGVGLFGGSNASWGQTITVPEGNTVLDAFTFYIGNYNHPSRLVLRAGVYAWDGSKATGPNVWESTPRTLSLSGAVFNGTRLESGSFTPVTFATGGVRLEAGRQYILFGSISKDFEAYTLGNETVWGFISFGGPLETYPGGSFVALNNGGDESQWTRSDWHPIGNAPENDLAFTASFSAALPASKDQCKHGGWRTYGVFKNQGDCVSFVATKGKNQPSGL